MEVLILGCYIRPPKVTHSHLKIQLSQVKTNDVISELLFHFLIAENTLHNLRHCLYLRVNELNHLLGLRNACIEVKDSLSLLLRLLFPQI
jgi:hypothetical protein